MKTLIATLILLSTQAWAFSVTSLKFDCNSDDIDREHHVVSIDGNHLTITVGEPTVTHADFDRQTKTGTSQFRVTDQGILTDGEKFWAVRVDVSESLIRGEAHGNVVIVYHDDRAPRGFSSDKLNCTQK